MHRPHHRSDQPFDMAAEAGRSRRPVGKVDPVLGASAFESQGVEFGAVVDMDDAGYAPRGPFGVDAPRGEPSRFVHHRMGQAKRDRRQRGRFEREMESHRHARGDVDRQRQRRPADREPGHGVDDRHIHLGVVNLHDRQRRSRLQLSRRRQKNRFGLALAFALSQQFGCIVAGEPATEPTNGRNRQSVTSTIGGDLGPEAGHRGTPARRIETAEMPLNDRDDLGRHRPHAGIWTAAARQQRAGPGALAKLPQPAEQRRPADPESRHRRADMVARRPLGQPRQDLRATLRGRPVLRIDTIKIHGQFCRMAAIWSHKLQIKFDASPRNCKSIPKLRNRKVVRFQ